MMICSGCQKESHYLRGWYDQGEYQEVCTECGNLSTIDSGAAGADVWWNGKPYYSEALDCEFTSKGQKARVMREKNVTELGNEKLPQKNWTEGSRQWRKKQFEREDKPKIQEIYKQYLERVRR